MLNIDFARFFSKKWQGTKTYKYRFSLAILGAILTVALIPFFYEITFWGKIFPAIKVADIDVGGLKIEEASRVLSTKVVQVEKITLVDPKQTFEIGLSGLDFSYNFLKSAQSAYELYRTGNPFYDFAGQLKTSVNGTNIGLRFNFNREKLDENLSVIAGQISQEPVYPSVKLAGNEVLVEDGAAGKDVDLRLLKLKVDENLTFAKETPIEIPIKIIDPTLNQNEAQKFKGRAEKLIGKKINLTFEYDTFTFGEKEIFSLLNPKGGYQEKTVEDLVEKISASVNRSSQNAVFIFTDGRVQEFSAAKEGVTVKTDLLKQQIIESLSFLETSGEKIATISIPATTTAPKITTGDVNNLGIKELIGRGSSRFKGSIASRVHNITLAASKFNSLLISPGEIFSFNNALGDVSIYTGYQQAYIIKEGKTVLGDGGGVCQVSTTLFRAALNAGLPIIERRAHSYRVAYYEQDSLPGIDATVYAPTTDLKIKNDTPAYILIQTQVNPKISTLVFELYGTKDGRVATTSKPSVTNPVPPPEDLYQDDPTLPAGTIKQIDWKAWGTNVYFEYLVKRAGETSYEKTFYSYYRPWQAVFLRGTGLAQ